MANISSAIGTLQFEGEWDKSVFDKFIKTFNKYLDDQAGDYYIKISNENFENLEAYINGCGRWSFDNNLSLLNRWVHDYQVKQSKEESIAEWNDLLKEMEAQCLAINVYYCDEESGMELLVEIEGSLTPLQKDNEMILQWSICNEEYYSYNRNNLVALKLYNNDNFELSMEELKNDLYQKFGLIFQNDENKKGTKLTLHQQSQIEKEFNEQPFACESEDIFNELSFLPETI